MSIPSARMIPIIIILLLVIICGVALSTLGLVATKPAITTTTTTDIVTDTVTPPPVTQTRTLTTITTAPPRTVETTAYQTVTTTATTETIKTSTTTRIVTTTTTALAFFVTATATTTTTPTLAVESGEFEFKATDTGYAERIIKGPLNGTYNLFTPKEGYKFAYLKVEVTNIGMKSKEPPLLGGDGEFKVEVDKGIIYEEINRVISLDPLNERYLGTIDPAKTDYPISKTHVGELNPGESEELTEIFEILEDTEPVKFTFTLHYPSDNAPEGS